MWSGKPAVLRGVETFRLGGSTNLAGHIIMRELGGPFSGSDRLRFHKSQVTLSWRLGLAGFEALLVEGECETDLAAKPLAPNHQPASRQKLYTPTQTGEMALFARQPPPEPLVTNTHTPEPPESPSQNCQFAVRLVLGPLDAFEGHKPFFDRDFERYEPAKDLETLAKVQTGILP